MWGIVPTYFEPFEAENVDFLDKRLEEIGGTLEKRGIDLEFPLSRSLPSPATCFLVNPDGEKTVAEAFKAIKDLSKQLREKYRL